MAKSDNVPLTPQQSWWLLATAAAAVLPLAPHVPPWLTGTSLLVLVWRGLLAGRQRPLPSRWLLIIVAIAGCAAILTEFHTLFGQNPGVALLMLFISLKQLEARTPRDGLAIIFLAYFLALAQFFYSQTIPAALTTSATVLVATTTLIALTDRELSLRALVRLAGTLLVQATPFMLLLFVLFPRVQGPLWALPKDAHGGHTGLSDTMTPGSISQLSQSDAIAFRVHFEGSVPPQQQLYWRGPVLSEFNGRTWHPHLERARNELPYREPDAGGIDYEIIMEPHGKPWLFALELPGRPPPDALATSDYQLLTREPITIRQRHVLRSYPRLQAGRDEAARERDRALFLPKGNSPRIRALAAGWRASARNDEDVLRLAQSFFRAQRLIYTLSPPLLGEQTADEFLFDTRAGFCEHFANAFAVAMRAAGIPARVVTGYQGGELNSVDGYVTVRQYDAHAWTEVWLPERGWLRVDPTAISAPMRIDLNLAAAVPEGDPLPLMIRAELTWLRELRFRWEAAASAWNQWVVGYNPERQRQLLQRLGMPAPDWRAMTAALAVLTGIAVLVLTAWALRQRRSLDPVAMQWQRLSRRLARHGLACRPSEGPLDYAERISGALPRHAADMHAIASLYGNLRYGKKVEDTPRLLAELRQRVAAFRPRVESRYREVHRVVRSESQTLCPDRKGQPTSSTRSSASTASADSHLGSKKNEALH